MSLHNQAAILHFQGRQKHQIVQWHCQTKASVMYQIFLLRELARDHPAWSHILLLGKCEFLELLRQPNGAARFVRDTLHLSNTSLKHFETAMQICVILNQTHNKNKLRIPQCINQLQMANRRRRLHEGSSC